MAVPKTEDEIEKAFKRIDTNGDNSISVLELRKYYLPLQEQLEVSAQLAEQEIEALRKRLDIDQNGTISLENSKSLCQKLK